MKKIILYLFIAIPLLSQGQQNTFKIKGKFENAEPGTIIFLKYGTQKGEVSDSATINDEAFSFEGTIPEITTARM